MRMRNGRLWQTFAMVFLLCGVTRASLGDRLHEFKDCVQVFITYAHII